MDKSKKKKLIILVLSAIIFCFLYINSVNSCAEEISDSLCEVQEITTFVDDNGNVVAVFIPDSIRQTDENIDALYSTVVSVDFQLEGYTQGRLSNTYYFNGGQTIHLNITINPQVSSNIGLYNHSTGVYGYPAGGLTSSGWYGILQVSSSGYYSLAFRNNSGNTALYTGSYEF